MKKIIIGALIFVLLLIIFAKYSRSGFSSDSEYADLVYKMLYENKATPDIIKALQDKGVQIDKIPTYITMGQMKLAAASAPAPASAPASAPTRS